MTQKQALKRIGDLLDHKVPTSVIFEIYDIVGQCNLHGWQEGREQALKMFAPNVAEILFPAAKKADDLVELEAGEVITVK